MTSITITHDHLEHIRKLIQGTIPNAANSSLFSSASVLAIGAAKGVKEKRSQTRERNSLEDAEIVRKHCILISRKDNVVIVSGSGRHDQSPVFWSATWKDTGNNVALCLDPQSLFCSVSSDLTFESKQGNGPIFQATRKLLQPGLTRVNSLVRRLGDSDTNTRLVESHAQEEMMSQRLEFELSEDRLFFHTLCHMTNSVNGTGFWNVIKSQEGESSRLTSTWELGNSSYGFMDMPSGSDTLPQNSDLILSQGNMKTLSWALDRFKDCTISSLQVDGVANELSLVIESEDLLMRVFSMREENSVTGETRAKSLSRCQYVQNLVDNSLSLTWTKLHPMLPLADGLGAAANLCTPITGREGQACLCVSVNPDADSAAYVFRGRNTEESFEFRIGEAGVCQDLPMWTILVPDQAKALQAMIKTLSNSLSLRNVYLHMDSNVSDDSNPGRFLMRGRDGLLAGGFFSKPREGYRILKSKKSVDIGRGTPYAYVTAINTLSHMKSVLQLGNLATLSRIKTENTNLFSIEVKDLKLHLEMGSDNHVAGSYLPIQEKHFNPKNSKCMLVRVKPSLIQSVLDVFEKVIEQSHIEKQRLSTPNCYIQIRMGDNEGLTFSLMYKTYLFSRIHTTMCEEPYYRPEAQLNEPTYIRLRPPVIEPSEYIALPASEMLKRLGILHRTFALEVPSEITPPTKLSLVGLEYTVSEGVSTFRAADTYRAIEWTEDSELFGTRKQILPPAFLTTAAVMKEKDETTVYVDLGTQMLLKSDTLYVLWEKALPLKAEEAFPTDKIRALISQRLPQRAVNPDTGVIDALGTPGKVVISVSKEMLINELEAIENTGIYGRVAWVWDKDGEGIIIEDDMIGTKDAPTRQILGTMEHWGSESSSDKFVLCISQHLLLTSLVALSETDLEQNVDVEITLSTVGIRLETGALVCCINPMALRENDMKYLLSLNTKASAF